MTRVQGFPWGFSDGVELSPLLGGGRDGMELSPAPRGGRWGDFCKMRGIRVLSGSENRDLVPNSEFLSKTFQFVPIFGTLVKF